MPKAHACGAHEKLGNRNFVAGGRYRLGGKPHVDRQRRYRQQKEWRGRKLDAPVRQQSRGQRARGDADGEDEVDRDFDIDAAADARLDDDRQQRQGHRADRPEPGDAERADPLPVVGVDLADDGEGRGEDVLADLQSRRADSGRRDGARRDVAAESNQHELGGHARRRAALGRRKAAEDEAADDRDEGRALDQRIAGDKLLAPKVVRQNAVFDRAEQRRDHAEPEQRQIEQRRRGERKTRSGDHLNEDLREFEPPGDQRLVMRIGDLAAERGQGDRRQDEDDQREQDLEARILSPEAEENEHRQHVADEIVVERGEELAPEQRREPSRRHQGPEHDGGRPLEWERMDA